MLREKLRWLYHSENLDSEIMQCKSEGKDISSMMPEIARIKGLPEGIEKEEASGVLLKKMEALPVSADFPYYEPDDYTDIIDTLPESYADRYQYDPGYYDKVYGAWAGRAIGCLLGIPVETWAREKIISFLKDTGNDPITGYLSSELSGDVRKKYGIEDKDETTAYDRQKICWINNVTAFPVDDDTNYSVASLKLLERYGTDFTTEDVAETWLFGLPVLHACTAERVAYKNLINGIFPPQSATYLNPFREWIGAQIRVDVYGYISPGDPRRAALRAYRDASISHVKNGIYGAMYVAALISLAPCGLVPADMVRAAMKQVPPASRLSERIADVYGMYDRGKPYIDMIDYIHQKYDEKDWFDWCHVIPNAMIVTAGLLYYGNDFDTAITNTVMSGFDTDCNAATIGSITGMMGGRRAIDAKWLNDIDPTLTTSIHGYDSLSLDELVARTCKFVIDA